MAPRTLDQEEQKIQAWMHTRSVSQWSGFTSQPAFDALNLSNQGLSLTVYEMQSTQEQGEPDLWAF